MLVEYYPERFRKNGDFPLLIGNVIEFNCRGSHVVSDDQMATIEKFPNLKQWFQKLVEKGILEIIHDATTAFSLAWQKNDVKALRLIEGCNNTALLLDWEKNEDRSNILSAIQGQLKRLEDNFTDEGKAAFNVEVALKRGKK